MNKWIMMLLIISANTGLSNSQTSDQLVAKPKVESESVGALSQTPSNHRDMITWPCPKKLNLS